MTRRVIMAALLAAACLGTAAADDLEQSFAAPPESARPWVYWFIMDGNLSREGITADLEAMRRAGIGGLILMEVDVGVPRGTVDFMGPQWRELFAHAVHEAERLGLEITLNGGPGWTGSGGPWVKPEQSMQHLVAGETQVRGPKRFDAAPARAQPRRPFFGEGALPPALEQARKDFYQDVLVLAFPTPAGNRRTDDIDEKALYVRAPYTSQPGVKPRLPAPADHPAAPPEECIAAERIVDLTSRLGPDGRLTWDVPEGDWTILRFGRASNGANTRPAPRPGLGLECDKFDKAALDAHFEAFIGPLLAAVGPRRAASAGWTGLHIDSWEMGAQNWTPRFREEFQRRRGYDPLPYLPAMTGRPVGTVEKTERFLWDLRQTAQELVIENHARHLRELGRRHGFRLSIEPYDMNPCADLSLGGEADVPMCEFWSKGHGFSSEFSCFEAASIAHTLGRPLVAAEAFTAAHTEAWRLYPAVMKAQADWALCTGINRFVFHRYQHQPWLDRRPGMTMGPYGVHWERTQTWWEMAGGFHGWLARCQHVLRRGLPVADILYLVPEGAPQVFTPPKSALRGSLPYRLGYNFDGCAPEVLLEHASAVDGRIVFPHGMSYRVLVLPELDTMTPRLLCKIKALVEAGATLVGAPPRKSPSLSDYPRCDAEVKEVAAALWSRSAPGSFHVVGKGRVFHAAGQAKPSQSTSDALTAARWIWHKEGNPAASAPVATRYFRRTMTLEASKAIESATFVMTADNTFELHVNGRSAGSGDSFHNAYVMDVAALLKPGANVLTVTVENGGELPNPAGLIGALSVRFRDGGSLVVPTDQAWHSAVKPDGGWAAALELGPLGMSPWGVPRPATSADIYPSHGVVADVLAKQGLPPDFGADVALGYTHRRDGDADIYFVANPEGKPLAADCRFRVTGRQPELWNALTGERRALRDYQCKDGVTLVPLRFGPHESYFVVFRRPSADNPRTAGSNFPERKPLMEIAGPWEVSFDPKWGGPDRVVFEKLEDWTARPEPGIRHYSGTATYRKAFDLAGPATDHRMFLSLGEVKNMASVRLNDKDLGVAWCDPWQVAIPAGLLQERGNRLEITVANLWPNRLIGDAALPTGQRLTWTTWNPYSKDTPLLPSGLSGPVTVLREDGKGHRGG